MTQILLSAARKLQVRAFSLFGSRGYVTAVAEATGYTTEYVGRIFNERVPLTTEARERIDTFLSAEEEKIDSPKAA